MDSEGTRDKEPGETVDRKSRPRASYPHSFKSTLLITGSSLIIVSLLSLISNHIPGLCDHQGEREEDEEDEEPGG